MATIGRISSLPRAEDSLLQKGGSGHNRYLEAWSKVKCKVMLHSRALGLVPSCSQDHVRGYWNTGCQSHAGFGSADLG